MPSTSAAAAVRKRVAVPALPRNSGAAGRRQGPALVTTKLVSSGSSSVTPICRSAAAISVVSLLLSAPVSRLVPLASAASSSARLVIDFDAGRRDAADERVVRRGDGERRRSWAAGAQAQRSKSPTQVIPAKAGTSFAGRSSRSGLHASRRQSNEPYANARGTAALLDRHALREIPRLVDVGAHEHGRVVGEQLHRDQRQDRRDEARDLRDDDGLGDAVADVLGALLVGDRG